MKMQKAPQLATSATGKINGTGSVTKDKYPALVANNEAIFNAPATANLAKLIKQIYGMSIDEYNAIYAPKGAETKMVDGVVHAAAGKGATDELGNTADSGIGAFGNADPQKHAAVESATQGIKDAITNPLNSVGRTARATVDATKYLGNTMGEGAAAAQQDTANFISKSANELFSGYNGNAVAPTLAPTAKPEVTPQIQPTANKVDTAIKTEVPPVVTPVSTEQPQVVGVNAAKITDTKQTAIPTELPITLAGMNTRTKDDDDANAIKHNVGGKTIYSDSMAAPQLPRPSVKPQPTQQQAQQVEQPITINGRTVNPITGAVIGDYQSEGVPADGIVQLQGGTISQTGAQRNKQRLASAEASSRDLSQKQMANDTPNAGASMPATQQPAPQLGGNDYFQPREDGMVSLPRDVTQSATGGSTPQERFAIQQQQLQQQPTPQLQVITTAEQPEPPQLIQMKQVRGMADAMANKYAGKQNDDTIAAYNATATARQKALDSAQGGEQFNQSLAEKKRQSGQDYSQHVLDQNLAQSNANRSAAAAAATAAQAQRNWEAENQDKNLVYTAGSSKLNPDTGAYETTPAQIFNKRTGEYRQVSGNNKAAPHQTAITQMQSIVGNPSNYKPEDVKAAQAFLAQFESKG